MSPYAPGPDTGSTGFGSEVEGYPDPVRRSDVRCPPSLLTAATADGGVIIVGAGCAGLSLAYYLVESGFTAPILILDGKDAFTDDRTWCFWDVEPTPFTALAVARWPVWSVGRGSTAVRRESTRHPYVCLASRDFYTHVLAGLSRYPNVALRLDEPVQEIQEIQKNNDGEAAVVVVTVKSRYRACQVFDARGLAPDSAEYRAAADSAAWLPQHFLGIRIRTRNPVFDAGTCTLMDFSVSQEAGIHFVYVLPVTAQEALVQDVYMSDHPRSRHMYDTNLAVFLKERHGLRTGDYVVDGYEPGTIPMTTHRFPTARSYDPVVPIGLLGGAGRPSTGYAFLRIQRDTRRLAHDVTARAAQQRPDTVGVRPTGHVGGPDARWSRWIEASRGIRYRFLDAVFLRFMVAEPAAIPAVYERMFRGVGTEPLVRFLTERSTLLDEASLILALPKLPLLRTAYRLLVRAPTRITQPGTGPAASSIPDSSNS